MSEEVFEFLMEHGADLSLANADDETVFSIVGVLFNSAPARILSVLAAHPRARDEGDESLFTMH